MECQVDFTRCDILVPAKPIHASQDLTEHLACWDRLAVMRHQHGGAVRLC